MKSIIMQCFSRLSKGRLSPGLNDINLFGQGFEFVRNDGGNYYRTEVGDDVGLFLVNESPNLPGSALTEEDFRRRWRLIARRGGVEVAHVAFGEVSGVPTVNSVVRAVDEYARVVFVGAITIPFQDFYYQAKIWAEDAPVSGIREAILLDAALGNGTVTVGPDGSLIGEWDPNHPDHDADFPNHPLSRVRRWLPRIESALQLSERLATYPKYALPVGS